MRQILKAITLVGPSVPRPTRIRNTTLMVPSDDAQMRIDVHCPIPHCRGVVTFVVSAIENKREMPDPAPCSECGVSVHLMEKILREAEAPTEVVRTGSS